MTIKTGDILTVQWGYEQTNVDFYYVQKATAKMATVVKMKAHRSIDDNLHGIAKPRFEIKGGKVSPVLGYQKPVRRKIHIDSDGEVWVKVSYFEYARPWDRTPQATTHYA